jgi:hypothetical protein
LTPRPTLTPGLNLETVVNGVPGGPIVGAAAPTPETVTIPASTIIDTVFAGSTIVQVLTTTALGATSTVTQNDPASTVTQAGATVTQAASTMVSTILVTNPAATVVQTVSVPLTVFAVSTALVNGATSVFTVTQTQLGLQTQTVTLPGGTGESFVPDLLSYLTNAGLAETIVSTVAAGPTRTSGNSPVLQALANATVNSDRSSACHRRIVLLRHRPWVDPRADRLRAHDHLRDLNAIRQRLCDDYHCRPYPDRDPSRDRHAPWCYSYVSSFTRIEVSYSRTSPQKHAQ